MKHVYVADKLRSHPFKCVSFPLYLIFFFILYWFVICPLIFVRLTNKYDNSLKTFWYISWIYYFWGTCFIFYIAVLSVIICFWKCSPKFVKAKEVSSTSAKRMGSVNNKHFYSVSLTNLNNLESSERNLKNEQFLSESSKNGNVKYESKSELSEEVCIKSVAKKAEGKIRPKSLHFKTEKVEFHRYSSPLTPREEFFYDLYASANRECYSQTKLFIENEKKYYNCFSVEKPKKANVDLTDCDLPRPQYCATSPLTFSPVTSTEVFLFVDGGKAEQKFSIRNCEQ